MINDETQRDLAGAPGGREVEILICHLECMRGLRSRLSWTRLTYSARELDIEHPKVLERRDMKRLMSPLGYIPLMTSTLTPSVNAMS